MTTEVKLDWITAVGYRAVILLVRQSHHCGYVALTPEHPLYGVYYNESGPAFNKQRTQLLILSPKDLHDEESLLTVENLFRVHGGVTYSNETLNCFVEDEEGMKYWWIGFDCDHSSDLSLVNTRNGTKLPDSTFKDLAYCRRECEQLADQLYRFEHDPDFIRNLL